MMRRGERRKGHGFRGRVRPFLRLTLTPQVMPRIRSLFFSGFSYVAFFMAQIYRMVRLLPDGHPYLNPAYMGRFGMRHVIAQAAGNLTFRRENADQIAVFAMLLIGVVIMGVQLFMLLVAGFVNVAHAGGLYPSSSPLNFFTYFSTPTATHDLAFVLLDRMFGIPGITGASGTSFFADVGGGYSCVAQGIACFDLGQSTRTLTADGTYATDYAHSALQTIPFPWPYHEAYRGMLQFYSVGLLVIGVFIFLYFAFALAVETAESGTPFGRRFNHIWAPLRIVTAMGLLVPITFGLNPAQWILMFAARWGSSFATNGWIIYNNAISGEDTLLGGTETLVATPALPPVNTLMEFTSLLAVCYESYHRIYNDRSGGRSAVTIDAWLINPAKVSLAPLRLGETTFSEAMQYFDRGTMVVRFGELRSSDHQSWDDKVVPFCGELTLDIPYVPQNIFSSAGASEPGSLIVEQRWYELMQSLWGSASGDASLSTIFGGGAVNFRDMIGLPMTKRHIADGNDANALLPTSQDLSGLRELYEQFVLTTVNLGVLSQRDSPEWQEKLTQLGWGGAAIWYNKIAQLNGSLVSTVYAMPTVKKYPYVMEKAHKEQAASNSGVSGDTGYRTARGAPSLMDLDDESNTQIARALSETRELWENNYRENARESNFFIDTINTVFGTQGLFDIVKNEADDVHPLAQLAAIGRTIVESAIRNLGYSLAANIVGIFQKGPIGSFAGSSGAFLFQVAMIGLSVGFVLFYVVPFLPFIYFFFAVGTWIKAIFEAMVGVPLWALAHIRIDGDGLPGHAGMGGYYLILEIFLRPILIIFGFIASITIFSAQIRILHEVWSQVTSNVSGFNADAAASAGAGQTGSITYLRGAVDEFFYTVIYAIICYMMAMGSFKLIDQIPNHILRWLGANVSTFGDKNGDVAQNLVRNSFIASNVASGRLKNAVGGAKTGASSGGMAIGELFGRARR